MTPSSDKLTLTQPDDWHLHLRDGDKLKRTVADAARYFGRALIMPNLNPPVTTANLAARYYHQIIKMRPQGSAFEPMMTLYLTDNTSAQDIREAHNSGIIKGIKLYPAGATTNSDLGVTNLSLCADALAEMASVNMPLLVHGEVTSPEVDIFDREKVFIDKVLMPLLNRFPTLRVVLEHITTADAADFVINSNDNVAATITAHHLLLNRNDLFVGGIRPHYYCLPVLKRKKHQQALISMAISGNPKFFLGTDSAPHLEDMKESSCGCAGVYTSHAALELYAEVFAAVDALDKLEGFASHFGADYYRLPRNKRMITLTKTPWTVPSRYTFADGWLIPLRAGESVGWQVTA